MSIYSSVAPTEDGTYWLRRRIDGHEITVLLRGGRWMFHGMFTTWHTYDMDDYEFGPRVPPAAKCAELAAGVEAYDVLETDPVFPGDSQTPYIKVDGKISGTPCRLNLKPGDRLIVERKAD